MIYFSYLHHLTLTHTLVASTAAVHENLSGDLQTLKCTICMIIVGTDTLCYMKHVTIKELSLCIFMLNKEFWVLSHSVNNLIFTNLVNILNAIFLKSRKPYLNTFNVEYCGLVTPCGNIDLDQHSRTQKCNMPYEITSLFRILPHHKMAKCV